MIVAATLWLFTFFYDASTDAYLKTLAVVEGLTIFGVWITLFRTYPRLHAGSATGSAASATATRTARAVVRRPWGCHWP